MTKTNTITRIVPHYSHMALCKQSRIFLDRMGDNFLMQILERTNKGNILCDLCTQTWKKKWQMWSQIVAWEQWPQDDCVQDPEDKEKK